MLTIAIACCTWWEGMEFLQMLTYLTVPVVHFTDQNRISKSMYCIRCVMTCKISFIIWNAKIALLHASMVVTYYIKLFQVGANRHNNILMPLLLLVAETIILHTFLEADVQRSSVKKGFLRHFVKFIGKTLCQSLFFNIVAVLTPATLLKKRIWEKCLNVSFAKFLKATFFRNRQVKYI